ncbi:MAG: alpha/beta fold hydrolase [Candidatus Andersenbacteria bacterium]|nr:alpha/beta fold hydrolase [bacterium]MDZ4225324.1 alpha/beta fold hydrolase [Candidatus Andersenbacteria bacterium]
MKFILIGSIGAVIIIGLLWQWYASRSGLVPSEPVSGVPVGEEEGRNKVNDVMEFLPPSSLPAEGGPEVDLVSLITFAEQEFRGHDFQVGRVLEDNEAYTRYYITYESGDLTISGIMNVPKGRGPFPLLLLNHGHIDTSVYTNGRGLKREQDYLARQGYAVIHSDYRGHAESDDDPNTDRRFRLGYAEDVINAVAAVKEADLPYIDTERVGMLGHSMGGGVAWRIAVTQPDLVDAYVQFAPVSADERDNFEKWTRRRPETAQVIEAQHGTPAENPVFWDNISPISFFRNVRAPIMIHHGTEDDSVPLEWSQRADEALRVKGKDVILHVYPGEPHEFIDAWPQVMQRTTVFFDQHLKQYQP